MADITDYINFNTDIDSAKISDVEQRIRLLMRERYPEVDTSDGSPFGNLVLTPICRVIALYEDTVDCMLSDLNLENAINNIVCDCDFIQNFLLGLGVESLAEVNVTSVARFRFNANPQEDYRFDQGQPLLFNDEYIFNIVGGNLPEVVIYPFDDTKGKPNTETIGFKSNNVYFLSAGAISFNNQGYEVSEFIVDLPIYGPAASNLSAGTLAAIDEDFPNFDNIISVELLEDIAPLEIPTNIGELAALCQKIAPSSNLTTKAGVTSFIYNKYPKAVGASPVVSGDSPEMIRDTHNEFSITTPKLDIYVKNYRDGAAPLQATELVGVNISFSGHPITPVADTDYTLSLSIKYNGTITNNDNDDTNDDPEDKLIFQHTPVLFRSLAIPTTTDNNTYSINLPPSEVSKCFIQSNLFSGTYEGVNYSQEDMGYREASLFEFTTSNISIPITVTYRQDGTYEYKSSSIVNEETYNYIVSLGAQAQDYFIAMTYDYDPLAEAVAKYVASPACSPAINTLIRPFKTAYVNALNITYRKDASRFFDRQQAIEDIYKFVNSITYPTTYDDGYIGDILITNGATGIDSITADVNFQGSAAYYCYNNPSANVVAEAYQNQTNNSLYIPEAIEGSKMKIFGLGARNINYILDRANINLIEKVI